MRNQIGVVKLSKKRVNSREFVENYIGEFKKLNGRENERTCEKNGPETRARCFFLTWQPSLGPSYKSKSRDLRFSRNVNLEIFLLIQTKNLEKKSRDFWGSPRKFFLRG
jgi:hypothetical protein